MTTDAGTPAIAYIGLGSNLDNPSRQVAQAVSALEALPASRLHARSPWYRSTAVGPGEQPDYINGVVQLETTLTATQLLANLQAIEAAQGRHREQRWAARTLDLDILLFGDQTIETPALTIPHPRLRERNFVLYPLADISPDLVLPDGTRLAELINHCPAHGLQRVRSEV